MANGMGDAIDEPSRDEMRAFLDALDPTDEEHGAAWLYLDDGTSLEWSVDGRLVLSEEEGALGIRHLAAVGRERVVELWWALSRGDLDRVRSEPWKPGNGYVEPPGRREWFRRQQLEDDRAYYDGLGAERGDTRCRRDGCARGAITHSVLCRLHHFESIRGRPSPFSH